jgi:hypothetical protein
MVPVMRRTASRTYEAIKQGQSGTRNAPRSALFDRAVLTDSLYNGYVAPHYSFVNSGEVDLFGFNFYMHKVHDVISNIGPLDPEVAPQGTLEPGSLENC